MSNLGFILRGLRENRGWSQKYVAQKMQIKQSSTYANWEYGLRDPDTETLGRLADLFGVSTDYLLGKTDNPNPVDSEMGFIGQLELSDEELFKRYDFKFDGIDISNEEAKGIIAFLRASRQMK